MKALYKQRLALKLKNLLSSREFLKNTNFTNA